MKNARHGDGTRDLIASCRVCRGDSNGVGAMVLGPMIPEKIEILAMEQVVCVLNKFLCVLHGVEAPWNKILAMEQVRFGTCKFAPQWPANPTTHYERLGIY